MSGSTKTLTNAEYYKLVSKGKSGWRCFFIMRDKLGDLSDDFHGVLFDNMALIQKIRNDELNGDDITHLKKQFVEMYDMLKKETECPVCFDVLNKENIEVPKCGHIICKTCLDTIKESDNKICPECRKKY